MLPIVIQTPRGPRIIGPGQPVFVIAEMSGNHNQSFERALELVDAAVEAGVDAIKLQTYTADTMTIDCDNEHFVVRGNPDWSGMTLHHLYEVAHTPWSWQADLKAHAESRGVLLFSSVFDPTSVDFLESLDVALYKVASFEIRDLALLKRIGRTGKPVILSRGMASIEDVGAAIAALRHAGTEQIAVLHCVSAYPAQARDMNLRTISDIAERFDVVPGLSDHTLGTRVAIAAVALGACLIEKHYTLRRADGGPDASFSLEPQELRQLVEHTSEASAALGSAQYEIQDSEAANIVFRRSIFVIADISKGSAFTAENIRVIRPGHGIAPRYYESVLGRRASRDIARGTPLAEDLVEGGLGGT